MTHNTTPRRMTDDDRRKTIELANAGGITANALNDKLGTTWKTSRRLLAKLAEAGELFARQTESGLRYFRLEEDAKSWQEPSARPKVVAQKQPRQLAKPAPVTIKRIDHKLAQIVIPPNVKRTRGPSTSFDMRYQVAPDTHVVGGFVSEWRNLCGDAVERKS